MLDYLPNPDDEGLLYLSVTGTFAQLQGPMVAGFCCLGQGTWKPLLDWARTLGHMPSPEEETLL